MLQWDHSSHQETSNYWVNQTDTTQFVLEEIHSGSLETKVIIFQNGSSVLSFKSVILKNISAFLSTNSVQWNAKFSKGDL